MTQFVADNDTLFLVGEMRIGQYGELYQRNEKGYIGQITYLDADGNPVPTNAG